MDKIFIVQSQGAFQNKGNLESPEKSILGIALG